MPQDINSLLPSVEFSLVFVLPLKRFLNFFFPFALWIMDILETCGECWFVCFFEANEMCENPSSCSKGVCYCILVLEITLPSFLFWLSSTFTVNPGTVSQLGIWRIIGFERDEDKGIPKQRDWTSVCSFAFVERESNVGLWRQFSMLIFSPLSDRIYMFS